MVMPYKPSNLWCQRIPVCMLSNISTTLGKPNTCSVKFGAFWTHCMFNTKRQWLCRANSTLYSRAPGHQKTHLVRWLNTTEMVKLASKNALWPRSNISCSPLPKRLTYIYTILQDFFFIGGILFLTGKQLITDKSLLSSIWYLLFFLNNLRKDEK